VALLLEQLELQTQVVVVVVEVIQQAQINLAVQAVAE
jgi:hypothetical protein